jgi:transposase
VESYRNDEGQPRQRIVASLGDARLPEDEKSLIAKAVKLRLRGQHDWFDTVEMSDDAATWVARVVQIAGQSKSTPTTDVDIVDGVIVDQIETEDVVQLGPQLVAAKAWQELGLNDILEKTGMNASAIATAQLMVSNRLIEPLSEWAIIDWAPRTVLPELLGIRLTKTTKDRLYKTSDLLLSRRKSIELDLRRIEADLFSTQGGIILYDVTNTHFEGECQQNPKAKHGKNKQKRNDCKQVAIGMAFDENGLPLFHETFAGNMADTSTLEQVIESLEKENDRKDAKPVVILDAGFASAANLQLIKDRGYSYLINITRSNRSKYAEEFEKKDFESLPGRKPGQEVEVKKIVDPDDAESHLVLCCSARRKLKEEAMISKAEQRFLDDAKALAKRVQKGLLKKKDVIERKIGALQKKHPRVNRFYTIEHKDNDLSIERKEESYQMAIDLCGNYVIKTDQDMEANQLWDLYMTLLKAERGFKMLKSELGLRPNYHQIEDRVDGHIFISILAYHLLSWIRLRFEERGDTREWTTIRRLLSTHSVVTTRLPLQDGRIINLRKPTVPDCEQQRVYQILGIDWRKEFVSTKTMTTL